MKTIDTFIKELQSISEEKRQLPLIIETPNGNLTEPKIKPLLDKYESLLLGDTPKRMIITH